MFFPAHLARLPPPTPGPDLGCANSLSEVRVRGWWSHSPATMGGWSPSWTPCLRQGGGWGRERGSHGPGRRWWKALEIRKPWVAPGASKLLKDYLPARGMWLEGLAPSPALRLWCSFGPLQLRAPGTRLKSEIGWPGEDRGLGLARGEGR